MINYQLVTFQTSVASREQLFTSDLPELVFAGRSNVGKSSLINKICNRKSLAHTGGTPGKTRTINFYRHPQFRFVDLPGYGYAKCSREQRADWGRLIEQYFDGRRDVRLVCALMDSRHAVTDDDRLMLDFLRRTALPFVIVGTKCEKIRPEELDSFRQSLPAELADGVLLVSARSGEGVDELKGRLEAALAKKV